MRIGSFVVVFASASAPAGRVATALAAAPPCEGVRVRSARDLAPEWAEAVRALVAQLPPIADSTCASVTLSVEPAASGGARLAAMAADGRYAERTLLRPPALAATALGLVASIPQEPAEEPLPKAGAAGAELRPEPSAPTPSPRASTSSAPAPEHVQLLVGLAAGARIGEPTPVEMFDFEARADALVSRWLLTLSLRYAPSIGPDNSDFTYEEVDIGLGAGRRVPIGRTALDLSLLPTLTTMNMQWDEDTGNPQSGGSSALRLDLSARWSTPLGDSWRFTVTTDADVSPAGLEHTLHLAPTAPPLPVWTAGLRLGAAGALL